MIFDTDVVIWVERGHPGAAAKISADPQPAISIQTVLELTQLARDKAQLQRRRKFIADCAFAILPLTPAIGQRAVTLVEEYGLSHFMQAGDAIIAATALEHRMPLVSANVKHFRAVRDLDLIVFRP